MEENNFPTFILSCERSGSTLVRYIIDTHPDICCPPELYIGELCDSLFRTMFSTIGQIDKNVEFSRKRENVARETKEIIENIMMRYATRQKKMSWCEKTPQNVKHLQVLKEIFPQAKYICLYRNCMDVVYSCIKLYPLGFMQDIASYIRITPENNVAALLNYWHDYTKRILQFEEENTGSCFRITYEKLVKSPEDVVSNMFHFLGYKQVDNLLDKVFTTPHDCGEGDLKVHFSDRIHSTSVGKGVSIPLTSIPSEMIQKIDALNRQIGYASVSSYYCDNNMAINSSGNSGYIEKSTDLNESKIEYILIEEINKKSKNSRSIQGKCRLIIQDIREGIWVIENSHGLKYEVKKGDQDADCTIALSSIVFLDLVKHKRSISDVYENGDVGVVGNISQAIEFGKLLFI